jgi:hypothetical protein
MHPLSLNHPKARGDARPAGPGLRSAEVGPSVITLRLTLPLVDARMVTARPLISGIISLIRNQTRRNMLG